MFVDLRRRFGVPGVISVVALIFALAGGAFAANNSEGTAALKAKVKVKKGPTGPRGAAGLQGAPGLNGKDGANGTNGTNGTDGAQGAPGKSVISEEFGPTEELPSKPCNERGGIQFETQGTGDKTYACTGEEGSPWTAGGTLPPGETETGAFSLIGNGFSAVSFNVPLAAGIAEGNAHYILANGMELHNTNEVTPTACGSALTPPGTVASPGAAAGHICLYEGLGNPGTYGLSGVVVFDPNFTGGPKFNSTGTGGAVVSALGGENGGEGKGLVKAVGTWAVTAP